MHEQRTGDTNAEKEQVVRWKPLDDFNIILSMDTSTLVIHQFVGLENVILMCITE